MLLNIYRGGYFITLEEPFSTLIEFDEVFQFITTLPNEQKGTETYSQTSN